MNNHPAGDSLIQLLEIMARLRAPEHGCPWDLEQTLESIAPYTVEEVYEVVEAINQGDMKQLESELGDLLFQVVFYARLGSEQGLFDFASIAEAIAQKLLRRHPHVFPDATLESFGTSGQQNPAQIAGQWEAIKAAERQKADPDPSILADVPRALPALMRAQKLQKRAARHGMDWQHAGEVRAKLLEELAELDSAISQQAEDAVFEEFGDLLFTLVNWGRHMQIDSETCLRMANEKFERRIRLMEKMVQKDGKSLDALDTQVLDQYWSAVKKAE